jgi:ABC-type antimicrobial peptide transport system permease subunit
LNVTTIESVRVLMSESLTGERSLAQLSALFAVLALVLAAAGLYGVTSYATARRTNEIGVRMALGASRGVPIRMILREALMLIMAGLAIGLSIVLIALELVGASVVGVSRTDPSVFGAVVSLMLIVGVFASGVPALRASRANPVGVAARVGNGSVRAMRSSRVCESSNDLAVPVLYLIGGSEPASS